MSVTVCRRSSAQDFLRDADIWRQIGVYQFAAKRKNENFRFNPADTQITRRFAAMQPI
jgi:hypothetical protein